MTNKETTIQTIIRMLTNEKDSKNIYWYPDAPANNDFWYPEDKEVFELAITFFKNNEITQAVNLFSRQDTIVRDAFTDIIQSVFPEVVFSNWSIIEETLINA